MLEATLDLVHSPPHRALLVLGYPDIYSACDHVMEMLEHKPIGLEGFDEHLVDDLRRKAMDPADVALLPAGNGWLLVEFGGDAQGEAQSMAQRAMDGPQARTASARYASHRRPARRGDDLEGARVGAGRDGTRPRRGADLARLGGFRRAAGEDSATICATCAN